jgi:phosphoribosylglycinamide formyltransferase 1
MPQRIAVLASGGGSNLQALLDHFNGQESELARVELVIGSRPEIGALSRAERAGVSSLVLHGRELGAELLTRRMLEALEDHAIDLIVLAGYLQLIPGAVVDRYARRIVNIHPALLPAFGGHGMYGIRVHRAVLAAGVRVSGATVHFVDEQYDSGAIIAQWPVPVLQGDTPETLAARVLAVEHRLLPATLDALLSGAGPLRTVDETVAFELVDRPAPTGESIRGVAYSVASPQPVYRAAGHSDAPSPDSHA